MKSGQRKYRGLFFLIKNSQARFLKLLYNGLHIHTVQKPRKYKRFSKKSASHPVPIHLILITQSRTDKHLIF